LVLHSGPWAAALFVFLLWQLASRPGDLQGFVWGLIPGALFMALFVVSALVRVRRRRLAATNAPNPSLNANVPHARAAPTGGPPVSLVRQAR
jgi:hypothetical protein